MDKKKKKKLLFFLGGAILILIIVIVNLAKSGGSGVTVQTEKVVKGTIVESVSGSAKIQPEIQVKISAKVSGQILDLGVKEGDQVKKGQFLVQLDQEYYRAAFEQNQSNLKYAQAGYEKARNEYDRSKHLFDNNLISQAELDIAKATYEQGLAQVQQYNALLRQAKDNLEKTTIYSPMDGVVSQLNKKVGEMAMGSQFTLDVIMIVADLSKMLAETEIDENDVVSVSVSDSSQIAVDAFPDTSFYGTVKEIANTGTTTGLGTQEEVTNFLVKVSMLEMPDRIRPGMSATVDIVTETKNNVLKVPIQCVTVRKPISPEEEKESEEKKKGEIDKEDTAEGKDTTTVETEPSEVKETEKDKDTDEPEEEEKPIKVCFVVRDGVAHQVPVVTGISSDTEWEIVSGLKEEDEVVSGSYRILSKQLKHEQEVKVDNSQKKQDQEEEESD
jgi:HlyD family secretion protein